MKGYGQCIIFGIFYLLLSLFALYRVKLYFDPFGGGRVITIFHSLILTACLLRSIYFFNPSIDQFSLHVPSEIDAHQTEGWQKFVISELINFLGNIFLLAVFILIICYWKHMLKKLTVQTIQTAENLNCKCGTLRIFTSVLIFLILLHVGNIVFFIIGINDSLQLLCHDSLLMTVVSFITYINLNIYSHRIRTTLTALGIITSSSYFPHIRRIYAITIAADVFLLTRVVVEALATVFLFFRINGSRDLFHKTSAARHFWHFYNIFKYSFEIIMLALSLLISRSIRAYSPSDVVGRQSSQATAVTGLSSSGRNSRRALRPKLNSTDEETEELTPLINSPFATSITYTYPQSPSPLTTYDGISMPSHQRS